MMDKNIFVVSFIFLIMFIAILLQCGNLFQESEENFVENMNRSKGGSVKRRGRRQRGRRRRWGGGGLRRNWPLLYTMPYYYPLYNYGLSCDENAIRNYRNCRRTGYDKFYCGQKFNSDTLYC